MREWEEKVFAQREAREIGLAEGRVETLECLNKLNKKLIADKRLEDFERATEDKAFQEQLLEEFGL